jgi:putative ABC transport system permease protein
LLLIALRDLQFRLRRFLISVVAVALILALTALLAGVAASFEAEAEHVLDQMDVDAWVVPPEALGPFIGAVPLPESARRDVAAAPGVQEVAGMVLYNLTLDEPSGPTRVNIFGVEANAVGSPRPDDGEALSGSRQAVVGRGLGREPGDTLSLAGSEFDVVGVLDESTLLGGTVNVFVPLRDLQEIGFGGAAIITTVAVRGEPGSTIGPLQVLGDGDAEADLVRPVEAAQSTITFLSVLLWIVAGCIIGSVIYLSALERVRDFAVFKAIGVSTSWILVGLMLQAALLSLAASAVAIASAWLLAPLMSIPVVLPVGIIAFVPLTAIVVALVASLAGVRRAVRVDPALAFG